RWPRLGPTAGRLLLSGQAEETGGASGPHSMLWGFGGASPPPAPTLQNLDLAPCAVLDDGMASSSNDAVCGQETAIHERSEGPQAGPSAGPFTVPDRRS